MSSSPVPSGLWLCMCTCVNCILPALIHCVLVVRIIAELMSTDVVSYVISQQAQNMYFTSIFGLKIFMELLY